MVIRFHAQVAPVGFFQERSHEQEIPSCLEYGIADMGGGFRADK
jgi:hypothetical protein